MPQIASTMPAGAAASVALLGLALHALQIAVVPSLARGPRRFYKIPVAPKLARPVQNSPYARSSHCSTAVLFCYIILRWAGIATDAFLQPPAATCKQWLVSLRAKVVPLAGRGRSA